MLDELVQVLDATSRTATRAEYASMIVHANCLAKPTISTRKLSNQRLGELYGLDPACPLFRVLRRLWPDNAHERALLALLAALARDPLLRATAGAVLSLPTGTDLQRGPIRRALRDAVGERLNDATLDKVARNAASTWTQSGHLSGRTFKTRRRVEATPRAVSYALYLGDAAGFRGIELLTTTWIESLDCSPSMARSLALEARRIGLIDLRVAGDVLELGFDRLYWNAAGT